ncbi:phage tail-collar fiber domain-containing protein [Leptotrichia sp. oral taxon 847]|uniref:phage tail-collar fiber domain-containing protein n=1 Tax=Leptotrichia sp. oral taxon 847 TaxID=1785996 RepID=UPI0009E8F4B1|nr:phage tail protein [Leptotrichia sp. oral taxon 847]
MAKFNGFILTEKGRELLAKGLAGETITFTKMAIGDGTSLTSERERTALVNQITTLPILNINAKGNGTCEISALLTNKSVTTGFYIKELGIFAHGNDNVEILYAYNISTSPDFVPPFSANNVVEIEYVDTIIVDQVANITAVIDPSITYITKKYADENYLVSSRLAEILGLQFGGNIQDIGNKTKGKFYYDSVTKFYYECIGDNSLTYNDNGKFRAISNKPISDKLENLYEGRTGFTKIGKTLIQWGYVENPSNNATLNYPVPFKNGTLPIVAIANWVNTDLIVLTTQNNQYCSFKSSKAISLNWIAVGMV